MDLLAILPDTDDHYIKILDQTFIQPYFVTYLTRAGERVVCFFGSAYCKPPPFPIVLPPFIICSFVPDYIMSFQPCTTAISAPLIL